MNDRIMAPYCLVWQLSYSFTNDLNMVLPKTKYIFRENVVVIQFMLLLIYLETCKDV